VIVVSIGKIAVGQHAYYEQQVVSQAGFDGGFERRVLSCGKETLR